MQLPKPSILACVLWLKVGKALASPEQQPLRDNDSWTVAPGTTTASAPAFRTSLLALHRDLVSIPSITGNERTVGTFLVRRLKADGWQVYVNDLPRSPQHSKRFNVVAWREPDDGDGGDNSHGDDDVRATFPPRHRPRVLLSSHIDVVPPYIPYVIDGEDGEGDGSVTVNTTIHGRGSVDAKAAVAAQIVAADELLASRDSGVDGKDLMLLFVVGEETTGDGMRNFSSLLTSKPGSDAASSPLAFDAVIFGEPTTNRLACGHKGHIACTVTAHGKSGHSGYPWLGKSATGVLVEGLAVILATDLGSSERWGNSTVNVGTLTGGVAANVIAERADALLAVRVAVGPERRGGKGDEDGESGADKILRRMKTVLDSVDTDIDITCDNGYGVVECDCDVDGFDTIVVNYGTDIPNLAGKHARYLYGPGDILVAHSDHEALTVGDLEEAVLGYQRLVKHALGID